MFRVLIASSAVFSTVAFAAPPVIPGEPVPPRNPNQPQLPDHPPADSPRLPTYPTIPGQPETQPAEGTPADEPGSGVAYSLVPRFKEGHQLTFTMSSIATQRTTAPGLAQFERSNTSDTVIHFTLGITSIDNDQTEGVLRFTRIIQTLTDEDGRKRTFDSANPDDMNNPSIFRDTIAPLVNARIGVVFAPDGTVRTLTGPDDLGGGGGVNTLITQLTGSSDTPWSFGNVFSLRPSATVARVGQTWSTRDLVEVPQLGSISLGVRYKAESVSRDDELRVSMDGSYTFDPNKRPDSHSVSVESSNIEGTYLWDTDMSMLSSMDVSTELSVDMTFNQKVSIQTTQQTSIQRTSGWEAVAERAETDG